jgi:hypothetical protein
MYPGKVLLKSEKSAGEYIALIRLLIVIEQVGLEAMNFYSYWITGTT